MTAPALSDLWRHAAEIRREWLGVGLTTEPADRQAAEAAITAIYVRLRRARPEFAWFPSPRAALPHLTGPNHRNLLSSRSVALDVAAGLSHLRAALAADYDDPFPAARRPASVRRPASLTPAQMIAAGLPFAELLRQHVREPLFAALSAIYLPQRAALGGTSTVPVGWYGNQDAAWIAHFDAMRRTGVARFRQERALDRWASLTRSAGWWWPEEGRCIMVDRPVVLRTEPEVGAAIVEYRDGWSV